MVISRKLCICISPRDFVILIQIVYVCSRRLCINLSTPCAWYQRFADYVSTIGFTHSIYDNSLFIYRQGNNMAYLLLYMDNIIFTTSSEQLRQSIITLLSFEFAMKDLGHLSYLFRHICYSYSFTRTSSALFLSQKKYAEKILNRAHMTDYKPSSTLVDTKSKLSATPSNQFHDPTEYRCLIGALQYLTFTRPDICYVVQQVCLFMHDPCSSHMTALKRILRYVKGTLEFCLHLSPSFTHTLLSYTNANWGGCLGTRRSTSGYRIYFGDNLISWFGKCQSTLSQSNVEAEYRGVANVVFESC